MKVNICVGQQYIPSNNNIGYILILMESADKLLWKFRVTYKEKYTEEKWVDKEFLEKEIVDGRFVLNFDPNELADYSRHNRLTTIEQD